MLQEEHGFPLPQICETGFYWLFWAPTGSGFPRSQAWGFSKPIILSKLLQLKMPGLFACKTCTLSCRWAASSLFAWSFPLLQRGSVVFCAQLHGWWLLQNDSLRELLFPNVIGACCCLLPWNRLIRSLSPHNDPAATLSSAIKQFISCLPCFGSMPCCERTELRISNPPFQAIWILL